MVIAALTFVLVVAKRMISLWEIWIKLVPNEINHLNLLSIDYSNHQY